jgi:chorismate-pyruvate lyase
LAPSVKLNVALRESARGRPTLPPPSLTLDDLYTPFPDQSDRPEVETVSAWRVPEPYRGLLVHTHHMTVTVEKFYGDAVDVQVLDVHQAGDAYARKILLRLRGSGEVVQFGIVQIDLSVLSAAVREEIVSRRTPLGRVLIRHNVLRTVRPVGYFKVTPGPVMCEWFGLDRPETTYGRLGVIYTDHKPAIRVAEILAPIREVKHKG